MSTRGAGKPLVAAMAILSGWVAIRASMWEPPFPIPSPEALFAQAGTGPIASVKHGAHAPSSVAARGRSAFLPLGDAILPALVRGHGAYGPSDTIRARPPALASVPEARFGQLSRSQSSASHQMLYAAAFAYLPTYSALASGTTGQLGNATPGRGQRSLPPSWLGARSPVMSPPVRAGQASEAHREAPSRSHWSADAWLLLRKGEQQQRLASVNPASYGSDQIGAVVRYALAPEAALDPAVYVRASKALVRNGEAEVAAGASVSLARSFPLRVHGELRVTDRPAVPGRRTEIRPAAFVTTGLPRRELAAGVEAESYLQAGYVGGDFETGFVDGKATMEAKLVSTDKARMAIGGGLWGGAQRDAARLDVGPTASTSLSTGRATLRASLDYRFRVAGDASPGNGPALTLTASF